MKSIINVAWCDDKINELLDKHMKRSFENKGCRCIPFEKAEDILAYLKRNQYMVDAVIVDFNLGDKNFVPSDNESTGFFALHSHLDDFVGKMPFYLYSGRNIDQIRKAYINHEINLDNDYFFKNDSNYKRYFEGGYILDLLDNLVKEVEDYHTSEHVIRVLHKSELEIARKYEGAEERIMKALTMTTEDYKWNTNEIIDMIRSARSQIERLFSTELIDPGLIKNFSLNDIKNFFKGTHPLYRLNGISVDNVIGGSLEYFLAITQDANHSSSTLDYNVEDYFKKNKDVNLVKSIFYTYMSLLVWITSLRLNIPANQPIWTNVIGFTGTVNYDYINKLFYIIHKNDKYVLGRSNITPKANTQMMISGFIDNDNYSNDGCKYYVPSGYYK